MDKVDVIVFAAHADDSELSCGGTIARMSGDGIRIGLVDLTRGEMGTRGTAAERAGEAAEAARILQVGWRAALDLPDGRVENTWENRLKVAAVIRLLRPRVVILPYEKGRHPDHYTASRLGYEACFLAGLSKLDMSKVGINLELVTGNQSQSTQSQITNAPPHRPFKIVYASLYYDIRPSFVVDISEQFNARLEALMAYRSQYADQQAGSDLFPARAEIRQRLETMAGFYGLLAGVRYAEPFVQNEVGLVDDLTAVPVQSI